MWKEVWVDATLNCEFEGHFQGQERSKLLFLVFALIWTTIAIYPKKLCLHSYTCI